MAGSWLRVAHRGASGSAPEHTRAAFALALKLRVDMIELDVQLTRDDQVVIIHDYDLERTTNGTGLVRDQGLAELKNLDAGSWFHPSFAAERLLGFDEVLRLVEGRARLNVEIKSSAEDWLPLVPRLIHSLGAGDWLDSTIISCFEPAALQVVRRHAARARLGLLWQRTDFAEAWQWVDELRLTSIHPHWTLVSPEVIQRARARCLQVIAWTVNDLPVMRRLVSQGVDGIISDFPERFEHANGSRCGVRA
jgi:glycerophosphoryl diester phosphodiesterase